MHLFIECLFEGHASLNNHAVQLFAWLRIFVSTRSMLWSVTTQCNAMRDALLMQFLIRVLLAMIMGLRFASLVGKCLSRDRCEGGKPLQRICL